MAVLHDTRIGAAALYALPLWESEGVFASNITDRSWQYNPQTGELKQFNMLADKVIISCGFSFRV